MSGDRAPRRLRSPAVPRVFSGIQPTGELHLGNLLGALRRWVGRPGTTPTRVFCVVDLHALTVPQDPAELRASAPSTPARCSSPAASTPTSCTLFVQSHVAEHTELAWLLECTRQLRRAAPHDPVQGEVRPGQSSSRPGCSPTRRCMAADILLYDTDRVPVGDDQRQHLELTRDVAERFNSRYGDTFVVPEAAIPTVGARVMDLQEPTRKMSKSVDSPQGTVLVLDDLGADRARSSSGRSPTPTARSASTPRPSPACRTCCRSSAPPPAATPEALAERLRRSTAR